MLHVAEEMNSTYIQEISARKIRLFSYLFITISGQDREETASSMLKLG